MKVYNEKSENNYKLTDVLKEKLNSMRSKRGFSTENYLSKKIENLNNYMKKCGLKSCVVAVSGGVDSAVVLGIVKMASLEEDSPIENIYPVLLPAVKSEGVTNQEDTVLKGKELCDKLDLKDYVIDISNISSDIGNITEKALNLKTDNWAIGQLVPYVRTPILYYITSLLTTNGKSGIVCGTTNKDEGAYLGYVGKASDGMVDIQLISDIHKSEVYKVANKLRIPSSIIKANPTGDMYDNREDIEVFGADYDFVELYLNYLKLSNSKKRIFEDSLDKESKELFKKLSKNLENLHNYNKHKYLAHSPAVHLDVYDSSVPNGWINYKEIFDDFMEN